MGRFKNLILLFLLAPSAFAGDRYFVSFKDKQSSPYSLQRPEEFLSPRSIQRRQRQGISLTEQDLPVNPSSIAGVSAAGARILFSLKGQNGVVVEIPSVGQKSAIEQLPCVKEVRSISGGAMPLRYDKFSLENSSQTGSSLRLPPLQYGNSYNQIHMIAADYLHQSGFYGTGMVIALLDAGFQDADVVAAFDSLRARNGILGTWDFVDNESEVYGDNSHGEEVLSCIASNIPGSLIGSAPGASFYLLRTEDVFTETLQEEYNWAAGAEYADSAGADIISSSLGYTTFDDPSQDHTYADMNGHTTVAALAANHAASAGMLVIVSAGNNGAASWNYISTPADADSALAVGAVNSQGAYAFFSSNGPSSDGDVKPNVAVQGQDTWVYFPSGFASTGNGTSFAAPLLAGAAACFWQAFDTLTNMEVFHRIEQCADKYTHPDTLTGYGIPNFMTAYTLAKATGADYPSPYGIVDVFPVPWSDHLHVLYYGQTDGNVQTLIYDAMGKKVYSSDFTIMRGVQDLSMETGAMAAGVYFLQVISADNIYTRTIVGGSNMR